VETQKIFNHGHTTRKETEKRRIILIILDWREDGKIAISLCLSTH
jgi:hypothetical protein